MLLSIVAATLLASASTTVATATAAPASEKKICRREKQIGSMVRARKTCRTKSEWDETASQAKDVMNDLQRNTRTSPNG
jgi:predicted secreted protein